MGKFKKLLKRVKKIEKQTKKTADTKNDHCGRVSKNILEVHYGR